MPAGGRAFHRDDVAAVAAVGPPVHLDGARLWNAAVAIGCPPAELAAPATTVMGCLSKGLGAPVGSFLAGPADLMGQARVERQRLGGAMRQAGVLAAAGLVALGNRARMAEDHARADRLAAAVADRWPGALRVEPSGPTTNMVLFEHPRPAELVAHMADQGVRAGLVEPGVVRLVTHLDVDDEGIDRALAALRRAPGSSPTRPSPAG